LDDIESLTVGRVHLKVELHTLKDGVFAVGCLAKIAFVLHLQLEGKRKRLDAAYFCKRSAILDQDDACVLT
jgi:hypothetical protein